MSKVNGGDGNFSVGPFLSGGDKKICAKNLFKERRCPCLSLLHDISAHGDCAISCRYRVGNQPEVTVGSQLFLKLDTAHCNACEKYILSVRHFAHILVTTVVGEHIDYFKNFSHPESVEV